MSNVLDYNLKNIGEAQARDALSQQVKENTSNISTLQTNVESLQSSAENLENSTKDLDRRVNNLERTTGKRFEVERKIVDSDGTLVTTTAWTRLYDAVGMEANATHDGSEVENDFDTAEIYRDIRTCEYDKKNGKIIHYIDDPEYDVNSDYDKMTIYPDMYLKREIITKLDGIYERRGVATQQFEGYKFYEGRMIARYEGSLDSANKLRSLSGKIPTHNKTIGNFRTYARNNGSQYEIEDIWTRFMLNTLYLVEYADNNSQNILGNGICTWLGDSNKALVAESSVNRIIVTTNETLRARLYEGKCISIGTSAAWNGGVCQDRKVTSVEDYDDGTVTGMAVYFDGDAVDIVVGNVLWGSAQTTGECDDLGMKSGCLVNDGEHSLIYRGVENPFGNMWEWVDGINLKAGNGTYVCPSDKHSQYTSDKFEDPYELVGYVKNTSEGWAKRMGYDENYPEIALPIEVGASSSTGYCDYYYNKNYANNRVAPVGGSFSNGSNCGFWYWHFYYGSGVLYWNIGSRLLKYQE